MKWWTWVPAVLLLLIVAIRLAYHAGVAPSAPQAKVAWTNPRVSYYYATVMVNQRGPVVHGKDAITQLSAQTGIEVNDLKLDNCRLIAAPDGAPILQIDGRLSRLAFPKPQTIVDLSPKIKDVQLLPSGEVSGQRESQGRMLFSADGKPEWQVKFSGTLLAIDITSTVYGYTFGWIAGVDHTTGKVLWQDRTESEPRLLGRDVLVLRGNRAKSLDLSGKTLWISDLGEKLLTAEVWDKGIYVLGEDHLFSVDRQGKLRWKRDAPGGYFRVTSKNGLVVVGLRSFEQPKHTLFTWLSGSAPAINWQDAERFTLVAFDQAGGQLWKWDTKDSVDSAAAQSDAGVPSGVPAERVYVTTPNAVIALDPPDKP